MAQFLERKGEKKEKKKTIEQKMGVLIFSTPSV